MKMALGWGVLIGAVNTVVGWTALLLSRRFPLQTGRVQTLGFGLRFALLFVTAQTLWTSRRRPGDVAVFVIVAAVVQTVGQAWVALKK